MDSRRCVILSKADLPNEVGTSRLVQITTVHVWLVVLNGLQSILGNFVLTVVVTLSRWEHSNFHTGILIGDYRARMPRSYSWSLRWRMVWAFLFQGEEISCTYVCISS